MQVRIVRLEPMRVACVPAVGLTPEAEAWTRLLAWAGQRGLAQQPADEDGRGAQPGQRLFGYDGSLVGPDGQHAYVACLALEPASSIKEGEPVELRDLEGGLYAVARCQLADVAETWGRLGLWVESSAYRRGAHPWLEEHLTWPLAPWHEVVLDLYHPVVG
jgi:DNA gyrase inhibitor GyrI